MHCLVYFDTVITEGVRENKLDRDAVCLVSDVVTNPRHLWEQFRQISHFGPEAITACVQRGPSETMDTVLLDERSTRAHQGRRTVHGMFSACVTHIAGLKDETTTPTQGPAQIFEHKDVAVKQTSGGSHTQGSLACCHGSAATSPTTHPPATHTHPTWIRRNIAIDSSASGADSSNRP